MIQYFMYKFGLFVIHCIPKKWAYAFARWMSEQHFLRSKKDREAVMRNLRQITRSEEGLWEKARSVFQNFGVYLIDFFFMYKTVNQKFIEENVVIKGWDNFEKAHARGKGVIILTAHIGNWEMGAALLGRLGHSLMAVALPHKERRVNELFNRQRQNYGVTVIPVNTAVRRCIEALKKNKCVALLGDRDFGTFGEPLPFFGRPTLIPKGASFFSLKTGAAILPSFVIPQGDGTYELSFGEAILPPERTSGDDQAAMLDLMKRSVGAIEEKIRANPTHWLMFREFGIEYEDLHPNPRVQRVAGARSRR
ncbi:MAG: lysophospholipid acyltransferase family protein [Candidatus Omnitrophica bacterium]|nr:lysophospholipid acyltransferase family protein [Candidatus Omnitrophota bacterium]